MLCIALLCTVPVLGMNQTKAAGAISLDLSVDNGGKTALKAAVEKYTAYYNLSDDQWNNTTVNEDDFYVSVDGAITDITKVTFDGEILSNEKRFDLSLGNDHHYSIAQYKQVGDKLYIAVPVIVFASGDNATFQLESASDSQVLNVHLPQRENLSLKSISKTDNNPFTLEKKNGNEYDFKISNYNQSAWTSLSWKPGTKDVRLDFAFNQTLADNDLLMTKKKVDGGTVGYGFTLPDKLKDNSKGLILYIGPKASTPYVYDYSVAKIYTEPVKVTFNFPAGDGPTVTGLAFPQDRLTLTVGQSTTLQASVVPSEMTGSIIYEISDQTIASLENDGSIKGKKIGTTNYVAKAGNLTATVKVNVINDQTPAADIDKSAVVETIKKTDEAIINSNLTAPTTADKTIFKAAKEENKDLSFQVMKEGKLQYRWYFAGDQITNPDMDLDLELKMTNQKPSTVNTDALDGQDVIYLNFKHHGDLPGPAKVKINAADLGFKAGDKVWLYYYNESTKQMEYQAKDLVVDENGYVEITITHCSTYALTKSVVTSAVENPKTGDLPMGLLITMLALGSAGMAYTAKKMM